LARENLSGEKEKPCISTESHLANCCVRSSNASKQFCDENLSLLFFLHHTVLAWQHPISGFGHFHTLLASRVFNDIDELLEAVVEFLNELQPSELQLVSHHWVERVRWVLVNNRDHSHGKITHPEFAAPVLPH
jgi:hypothetical protein